MNWISVAISLSLCNLNNGREMETCFPNVRILPLRVCLHACVEVLANKEAEEFPLPYHILASLAI